MTMFIIVLGCKGKKSVYKGRQTYLTVKKMGKLPKISKLTKSNKVFLKQEGYKNCEIASRFGLSEASEARYCADIKKTQVFIQKEKWAPSHNNNQD